MAIDLRDLLDARRWTREQAEGLIAIVLRSRQAQPLCVPLNSAVTQWVNQPLAETPLLGAPAGSRAVPVDLSRYSEIRVTASVTIGGASGAVLRPYAATTAPMVAGSYLAIGSASASIAGAGVRDSGWQDIPVARRLPSFVDVWGAGGDGVADPSIGLVLLWLR